MMVVLIAAVLISALFLAASWKRGGKICPGLLLWGIFAAALSFSLEASAAVLGAWGMSVQISIAPFIEEGVKSLPLILLLISTAVRERRDYCLPAAASGIGFAAAESVILSLSLFDAATGFLLHAGCAAIIGLGAFYISDPDRRAAPYLLFGLYTIAVTVHSLILLIGMQDPFGKVAAFLLAALVAAAIYLACRHDPSQGGTIPLRNRP